MQGGQILINLTFLGGAGTVTGSKYLLECNQRKLLVDCGLFQGFKQLRLRNWRPSPIDPLTIGSVILTHAHIDHSGYLPLLVRQGFRGQILCTEATRDLCEILLPDSGYLLERDAEFANRHGYSKHKPAKPLYTQADAEAALQFFRPVDFDTSYRLDELSSVRFLAAGHILGAAIVELNIDNRKIVFSGDLGRSGSPTMPDPTPVAEADYLLVESTYGNRKHDKNDPEKILEEVVNRTAARGGTIVIPSFAVGRAQALLFHLQRLKSGKKIPDLPIFLDSPMAVDASEIFCRHLTDHRLTAAQCRLTCNVAQYTRSVEQSKNLDTSAMPKIIVSASGMATGGRVLHHLKHYAPDPRNTILFAGFQAGGTRGAQMLAGSETIKIHGGYVPVRAELQYLSMLSAHADADEIMSWLGHFRLPPRMTYIVHGEPDAADALRHRIEEDLNWQVTVAEDREVVKLS